MNYKKPVLEIINLDNKDLVLTMNSNQYAFDGRELAIDVFGDHTDSELNELLKDVGINQGITGLGKLMDEAGDWGGLSAWIAEADGDPVNLKRMVSDAKTGCGDTFASYSNDSEEDSFDGEW